MRALICAWAVSAACLVLAGSACSGGGPAECESNEDCEPNEICVDDECEAIDGRACGANQACPAGQHCCGGVCGDERCCVVDTDCAGGYCQDNRCQDGARPPCGGDSDCPVGHCLQSQGICVECTLTSDCAQPGTCPTGDCIECGPDHTCIEVGQGCTQSDCDQYGLICSPSEGCRECIPDTSDCGNQVCVLDADPTRPGERVCTACDPADPERACAGGLTCVVEADPSANTCTVPEGTWCDDNDDCGDKICRIAGDHEECVPCATTSECGAGWSCSNGRCVANQPDCTTDQDCNPPVSVCRAGSCVEGCTRGSCTAGQACSTTAGRCYITGTGEGEIGEACDSHADCLSGACWRATFDGQESRFCSQSCVTHDDCPDSPTTSGADQVCWELGDVNICVPVFALYDAPYPAFELPGTACSGELRTLDCSSGYCRTVTHDATQAQCMEICARDSHCDGVPDSGAGVDLVCVSAWPVGSDLNGDGVYQEPELDGFTQLCHQRWGHVGPNLSCATGPGGAIRPDDHDSCASGWCVQTPDLTRTAHCAEPCCTPADCDPSRPICKPIDVYDGIREANDPGVYGFQKICLWREYSGTKAVGELCNADSECKSEICTASTTGAPKRCTTTCCTNDDCAGYTWAPVCRKPFPIGGTLYDSNIDGIQESLGRLVDTGDATGQAMGMSGLCLP